MNGEFGEAAALVKAFAAVLGQTTPIRIQLIDERLSTVQASRQLQEAGRNARKQRGLIDSEAACVLLQGYLDSQTPFPLLPPDA
jgi:putative Holliday junction resolvase